MRIGFWVSVLLGGLLGLGVTSVSADAGPSVADVRLPMRLLQWPDQAGRPLRVRVAVDDRVRPGAQAAIAIEPVGELPGGVWVVADTHLSRPGGMSMCAAGHERFLRVLVVTPGGGRETFRTKLESCRDNIELASPGLEWNAQAATLRVNWLQAPGGKGLAASRVLNIRSDGRVE